MFYERMRQDSKKTPLDDRPKTDEEVNWFLSVFNTLSNSRPVGMDYGALVLSEIIIYWEKVDQFGPLDEFIEIMHALDRIFLQYRANQRESEQQSNQVKH